MQRWLASFVFTVTAYWDGSIHAISGPRSHQHLPNNTFPTFHRARARASASAFCAAVSGSCTSFAALICRSLIYLAIHTYISKYVRKAKLVRPPGRIYDLAEKKCNRWLKSFAGSWNCIEANAFLSVYSMGSLTTYYTYLCHSYANLIRCATEPAPMSTVHTYNILLSVLKFN